MPEEQLQALWHQHKVHASPEARNRLVEYYLPLVWLHAEKLKNRLPARVELEDLVSVGCEGLIGAVKRFDPARGNTFETYCASRIAGSMLDHLRLNDWVPRHIRNFRNTLEEARKRLLIQHGREPNNEELAAEIGLELEEFHKWQQEAGKIHAQVSLESACDEDDQDMQYLQMLADRSERHPLRRLQLDEVLNRVLPTLPKRERDVINMYYCRDMTMKEIGRIMGLSESRVCQIRNHAIALLRTRLDAEDASA